MPTTQYGAREKLKLIGLTLNLIFAQVNVTYSVPLNIRNKFKFLPMAFLKHNLGQFTLFKINSQSFRNQHYISRYFVKQLNFTYISTNIGPCLNSYSKRKSFILKFMLLTTVTSDFGFLNCLKSQNKIDF